MAHVPVKDLDATSKAELCCTYAALILYDDGVEITADKINKLLAASDNKVEAYWPALFAKALQGRNIGDLLLGGGGAPAGPAPTTAPVVADKKEPAKKEAPKKEEPKEEDIGGPIGLFGDDF